MLGCNNTLLPKPLWGTLTLGLRVSCRWVLHYYPPGCGFLVLPLRLQAVDLPPGFPEEASRGSMGCNAAPRPLGLLLRGALSPSPTHAQKEPSGPSSWA